MLYGPETAGRRVVWLLTVTWAGQTIRMSDDEIDVDSDDGTLHYAGVLPTFQVESSADWLSSGTPQSVSAAIEAVWPIDVPALVLRGHDIGSASAELARHVVGDVYEDRVVVLIGHLTDPQHGRAFEPVAATIESPPWGDGIEAPPPGYDVAGGAFAVDALLSLPESGLGRCYPHVFGRPGVVSTAVNADGRIAGSEAIYFDQRTTLYSPGNHVYDLGLLLTGGHAAINSIMLKTTTDRTWLRYKVIRTEDDQGRPITIAPWWYTKSGGSDIYYDAAISYTWSPPGATTIGSIGQTAAPASIQPAAGVDSDGVWVCWEDQADDTAGGIMGPDGVTMRGAGTIIAYLLAMSGRRVDAGRWASAAAFLDRFRLDFVIDDRVDVWEFLSAEILPLLPLSVVDGPDGLTPVVWRWDAVEADSVADLTVDDVTVRAVGTVDYDREVYNDISVGYALAVRANEFQAVVRVGGAGVDADGGVVLPICDISQRRYAWPDGRRRIARKDIDARVIYDDATAGLVAQWMAAAWALARRRIEVMVDEGELGWLSLGDVVVVADTARGVARTVGWIEAISRGSSGMTVRILIVEAPARDVRVV